jgi:hypothetical protein
LLSSKPTNRIEEIGVESKPVAVMIKPLRLSEVNSQSLIAAASHRFYLSSGMRSMPYLSSGMRSMPYLSSGMRSMPYLY